MDINLKKILDTANKNIANLKTELNMSNYKDSKEYNHSISIIKNKAEKEIKNNDNNNGYKLVIYNLVKKINNYKFLLEQYKSIVIKIKNKYNKVLKNITHNYKILITTNKIIHKKYTNLYEKYNNNKLYTTNIINNISNIKNRIKYYFENYYKTVQENNYNYSTLANYNKKLREYLLNKDSLTIDNNNYNKTGYINSSPDIFSKNKFQKSIYSSINNSINLNILKNSCSFELQDKSEDNLLLNSYKNIKLINEK